LELDPLMDDARLRIWVVQSQLGEPTNATSDLSGYIGTLKSPQADYWPVQIARFLTGMIKEEDFLTLANISARNPKQQASQMCQAEYYAGMKHLLDNDKKGAMAIFKKCLKTGEKGYPEYASADVELAVLKGQ
jgi:lipoprotein NlpI